MKGCSHKSRSRIFLAYKQTRQKPQDDSKCTIQGNFEVFYSWEAKISFRIDYHNQDNEY